MDAGNQVLSAGIHTKWIKPNLQNSPYGQKLIKVVNISTIKQSKVLANCLSNGEKPILSLTSLSPKILEN